MSTQQPDNTSATAAPVSASEPSPALQPPETLAASSPPQTSSSPAATSPWQSFSERRIAFFARREGLFLWLLSIPMLLAAVYMILHYLSWTSGQGGLLDSILTRDWQP